MAGLWLQRAPGRRKNLGVRVAETIWIRAIQPWEVPTGERAGTIHRVDSEDDEKTQEAVNGQGCIIEVGRNVYNMHGVRSTTASRLYLGALRDEMYMCSGDPENCLR